MGSAGNTKIRNKFPRPYADLAILCALLILFACAPEAKRELKSGDKSIILTGTVLPFQSAEVKSPTTAVVRKIMTDPGKKVGAGEDLVLLDAMHLQAEASRAEAALSMARTNLSAARLRSKESMVAEAEAEVERLRQELRQQERLSAVPVPTAEYEQAKILLENAQAKVDRIYGLYAQRAVSKTEVEAVESEYAEAWRRLEVSREALERKRAFGDSDIKIAAARYQAAHARLAALKKTPKGMEAQSALAQVQQAEADLARARYNLRQTTLAAPIPGIVTEVMVQSGEKVYEGKPAVNIVDISQVRIKADLSPGLLPYVFLGQKAEITVHTVPPTRVPAGIAQIQPVADPKSQSVTVSFILPNPQFKFQPGYTARVEIPVDPGRLKPPQGKTESR